MTKYSPENYRKNKESILASNKKFRIDNPWYDCWRNAHRRCTDPKNKNYFRMKTDGIICVLTKEEVIFMWTRDRGHLLKKPSIDRIDAKGHYEISNCRFIEFLDNVKRMHDPSFELQPAEMAWTD